MKLFSVLSDLGVGVLGTIRVNHFPGLQFQSDKEIKKRGKVTFDEVATKVDCTEIRSIKWYDNHGVTMASSFDCAQPIGEVNRFNRKTKTEVTIPCQKAVNTYNTFMGGVDLLDRLISYYRISLHIALVNGWLLNRRHCDEQNISHKDQSDLLAFRCDVTSSLCKESKRQERKRGRPCSDSLERQI
ncbi:hypothetical protein PR048_011328 [Dryococelus australis]|uniref:PiggyBac transposable element-derived protein domain-containing protein n=1 Tax=Dryococelus australis TaxID=614101 RepID=A0ABQ9HLC2_9NEOP|nr:hypothetical protein PR048_011328 [Dryococelus australis]